MWGSGLVGPQLRSHLLGSGPHPSCVLCLGLTAAQLWKRVLLSELTPGATWDQVEAVPHSMSWLSHLLGPVPHHPHCPCPARPSLCISWPELLPPTPLEGQLKRLRLFSHRLEARRLRWRCGQVGSLRRPLSLACRLPSAAVSPRGCFSGPPRPWIPSVCPNPLPTRTPAS